jgi:hypothetical protein
LGIAEDFYGLKSQWSKITFGTKVIFILSFSLSVLTVGSLADSIFSFKGFVVAGIEFYREFTEPVRTFISSLLNVEISRVLQDSIIMAGLWLGSVYRFNEEEHQRSGVSWLVGLLVFWLITFGLKVFIIQFFSITAAILIIFAFAPLLYAFTCNKSFSIYPQNKIEAQFILIVYFFVACIAAISDGLTRPL